MTENTNEGFKRIVGDFDPETWENGYRGRLGEFYEESVRKLAQLEEIDEIEADVKLMSILIQTTFIERSLILNGAQNADHLFKSLEELCSDQENPFESAQQVAELCLQLAPVFISCPLSGRIQNTGAGFKKFCVHLVQLIENGDVVDENTIGDIVEQFYDTIPGDGSVHVTFLKRELHLEFDNLEFLAIQVPVFEYDVSSRRLRLTPEASSHLPTRLPIFLHTFDAEHPFRLDTSRTIRALVKMSEGYNMVVQGEIVKPYIFKGIRVVMKEMHGGEYDEVVLKPYGYWQIIGAISPNNYKTQVMVLKAVFIPDYNPFESFSLPNRSFQASKTTISRNFDGKWDELQEIARTEISKKSKEELTK